MDSDTSDLILDVLLRMQRLIGDLDSEGQCSSVDLHELAVSLRSLQMKLST